LGKSWTRIQPKYRSTVWSIILLLNLGALASEDKRIEQACKYLLEHALAEGGQLPRVRPARLPALWIVYKATVLVVDGVGVRPPALRTAYEWMARTVTGDGIAPLKDKDAPVRYYAYKCGSTFACGVNNKLACAWGGCKVMMAFSKWPVQRRTALIKKAIKQGCGLLLSIDPATADYPNGYTDKPSGNWWKFGFPVFYVSDILQIAEAMVGLGYGNVPASQKYFKPHSQKTG